MTVTTGLWILGLCLAVSRPLAAPETETAIGEFSTVEGEVLVTHSAIAGMVPIALHDPVFFKDSIETREAARTKALFLNETLLIVGENSRVEIDEHIYDPNQNRWSITMSLLEGKLRALVGEAFGASGSRFKVRTSTAVFAARGTYFVVWVENGRSGGVNLGEKGNVDFTSEGHTVSIKPGEFSEALAGHPPTQPALSTPGVSAHLTRAVQTTELEGFQGAERELQQRLREEVKELRTMTAERAAVPQSGIKGEKAERSMRPERPERSMRPERPERPMRPERPERPMRPR